MRIRGAERGVDRICLESMWIEKISSRIRLFGQNPYREATELIHGSPNEIRNDPDPLHDPAFRQIRAAAIGHSTKPSGFLVHL